MRRSVANHTCRWYAKMSLDMLFTPGRNECKPPPKTSMLPFWAVVDLKCRFVRHLFSAVYGLSFRSIAGTISKITSSRVRSHNRSRNNVREAKVILTHNFRELFHQPNYTAWQNNRKNGSTDPGWCVAGPRILWTQRVTNGSALPGKTSLKRNGFGDLKRYGRNQI